MEADAKWSTDKRGKVKTYCCINASSRDYLRFGRLWLNEGRHEGKQVVPKDWIEQSLSRNIAEGSSHGYNFLWHIGLAEYGDFMAAGLFKQFLYIYPKKNLVMVVLNDRDKAIEMERRDWIYVLRQLADQL